MREDDKALCPWDIYGYEAVWPISSSGMFLGKAVQIVGQAAIIGWSSDTPTWMRINPPPGIPAVYDAFDHEKNPVSSIHKLFADVVRSIKSPGIFEAERLSDAMWLRSLVTDPDGGEPLPACALRARLGEDHNDPVTYEHWEDVSIEAARLYHNKAEGNRSMALVARVIHSLAVNAKVRCFLRAVGGSIDEPCKFRREYWEIDDPLPRLAWCGINLDAPFDPKVPPSHWIFVDEAQLRKATAEIKPQLLVDPGPVAVEDFGYSSKIIDDTLKYLLEAFNSAPANTRKDEFRRSAAKAIGWGISETNWRLAWGEATRQHPERIIRGRPRKRM